MCHLKFNAVLVGACILQPCAAPAADSVLFNPKVDGSSVSLTGVEARFRFHRKQWDSSLTANLDEDNVGTTANISNDVAQLLNTVYAFSLSFSAQTKMLTWSILGGPLVEPNVMTVVEVDAFNALRFNAKTVDPTHVMTYTDFAFTGLPGSGTLRSGGEAVNDIDFQRIVATSGLLSDSDWSISGKVSTTGTNDNKTKFWVAAQNVALKVNPNLESVSLPNMQPVPEPSTVFMFAAGLTWLARRARIGPRRLTQGASRAASAGVAPI